MIIKKSCLDSWLAIHLKTNIQLRHHKHLRRLPNLLCHKPPLRPLRIRHLLDRLPPILPPHDRLCHHRSPLRQRLLPPPNPHRLLPHHLRYDDDLPLHHILPSRPRPRRNSRSRLRLLLHSRRRHRIHLLQHQEIPRHRHRNFR